MTSESDSFAVLSAIFNDRVLKSSSRLLILLCLSMNKKLGFTELSRLTGLSKGSLGNHLLKLSTSGYVTMTEYAFFSSKRVTVKITEKGNDTVHKYIVAISEIEMERRENTSSKRLDDSLE
ncbi:MAG: MarR family winged helix-turn-helix transcriptional regulator [Candidatus Thermoplasmatota archaeon]|jgi:DNA-binding MarR family transcriptional regulator|nr:MarR family winged helix-turn-helix transcriptional regulator [Candidatus Thermoplasmatota archaeon]MCL5794248.1 MarR family winged helix-turn-helix transcriptional regulator [Candidatus Thermoplasmatota archaeon]